MMLLLRPVPGVNEYRTPWPERPGIEGFKDTMKHPRSLLGCNIFSVDE